MYGLSEMHLSTVLWRTREIVYLFFWSALNVSAAELYKVSIPVVCELGLTKSGLLS